MFCIHNKVDQNGKGAITQPKRFFEKLKKGFEDNPIRVKQDPKYVTSVDRKLN